MRLQFTTHIDGRTHKNLTRSVIRHIMDCRGKRRQDYRANGRVMGVACGAGPMHVVRLDDNPLQPTVRGLAVIGRCIGISANAPEKGGSLTWSTGSAARLRLTAASTGVGKGCFSIARVTARTTLSQIYARHECSSMSDVASIIACELSVETVADC